MKPLLIAIALAGAAYLAPVSAEASRCPSGYIYRPSANICQFKGRNLRYSRANVRKSEARRARIEARRTARKARIAAASARRSAIVGAGPAPIVMERTPMWDAVPPEQIAASPFGQIIWMPETPTAWAIRNGEAVQ